MPLRQRRPRSRVPLLSRAPRHPGLSSTSAAATRLLPLICSRPYPLWDLATLLVLCAIMDLRIFLLLPLTVHGVLTTQPPVLPTSPNGEVNFHPTTATSVAEPTTTAGPVVATTPPPAGNSVEGSQPSPQTERQGRGLFDMGGAVSRVLGGLLGVALRAAGNHAPSPSPSPSPFSAASPFNAQPPAATASSGGRLAGLLVAAMQLLGLRAQSLSNAAINGIIYVAQMIANAFAIPTPTPTTYHPPPPPPKRKQKPPAGKRRGPDNQAQGQNQRQGQGSNAASHNQAARPEQSNGAQGQLLRNRQAHQQNQNFLPVQTPAETFAKRKDYVQQWNGQTMGLNIHEAQDEEFAESLHEEQQYGEGSVGGEFEEDWSEMEDPEEPDLLEWIMLKQQSTGEGRALFAEASSPGLAVRAAAALPAAAPCVRLLVCSLAPVVSAMQRALQQAALDGESANYTLPGAANLARAADRCQARFPQCQPL